MKKCLLFLFSCGFFLLSAQLPDNFFDEVVSSDFTAPTGITFDQNGTGYLWERGGKVFIVDQNGLKLHNPLLDISEEVGDWGDHGLLGFALHPDFLSNGHFYVLYVVDRHHLMHFGTAAYDPNANDYSSATIARLTRYTADASTNFKSILPDSRKVLIGHNKQDGFPINTRIHGIGSLVFGEDGTLLISSGDSAFSLSSDVGSHNETFFEQSLLDTILLKKENIGSYRSQLVDCLSGKILRVDPETGMGLPSNPFYDPTDPDAPRSKVWALGLRNPFRFCLRPGSGKSDPSLGDPGTLYISDVGAGKFEELNIASSGGHNFGWPFYEGFLNKVIFQDFLIENLDAPNPLNCGQYFFNFQNLIQLPSENGIHHFPNPCDSTIPIPEAFTFVLSPPALTWRNSSPGLSPLTLTGIFDENGQSDFISVTDPDSPISGEDFEGIASIGGLFYTGDNFPESYQGTYFQADFNGWIKTLEHNSDQLLDVEDFHSNSRNLVSMAVHPIDGCIYYLSIENDQLRKVCYGGNPKPVIITQQSQNYGPSPHQVQFNAEASYSPLGYPLTFFWDFNDGSTSTAVNPVHLFETSDAAPKQFEVLLTVTDSAGISNNSNLIVSINNTPPVVQITSPKDSSFYPLNGYTLFDLEAMVSDLEHQPNELDYEWQTFTHHNTHVHAEPVDSKPSTQTLIEPLGCDPDDAYWYEVRLEVTDRAGLKGSDRIFIFPYCGPALAEIIDLNGKVRETDIQLDWTAFVDSDSLIFEIQRSDNFTVFATIGFVETIASENQLPYVFYDSDPLIGRNRYRIKSLHDNGIFEYSDEVVLNFPPDPRIKIYPNPAATLLYIDLRESNGNVQLQLLDYTGKQVYKEFWTDANNSGAIKEINVTPLPNGLYFYNIQNGLETFTGSLLILK